MLQNYIHVFQVKLCYSALEFRVLPWGDDEMVGRIVP